MESSDDMPAITLKNRVSRLSAAQWNQGSSKGMGLKTAKFLRLRAGRALKTGWRGDAPTMRRVELALRFIGIPRCYRRSR